MACYEAKMGKGGDNLNVGRLADLSKEQWAVFWEQEDPPNRRWYAWAPVPGYVLFGSLDTDRARIPRWVLERAHRTGHERIDLMETPDLPLPELIPTPRPVPPILVP